MFDYDPTLQSILHFSYTINPEINLGHRDMINAAGEKRKKKVLQHEFEFILGLWEVFVIVCC